MTTSVHESGMNPVEALCELGVTEENTQTLFTAENRRSLDEQGFVVLPDVFTPEQCQRAAAEFDRLSAIEGEEGGREVHTEAGARRVSNIFNKTDVFDVCLTCPRLLAAARYLLGDFKVHGANLREPLPGFGAQDLHVDVGRDHSTDWQVLNALILFDDMTPENGATRVIPGSHRWPAVCSQSEASMEMSAEDRKKMPEDRKAPYSGEVYATAPAGFIVAINSVLWHSGTRNVSGARRRQLHLTFTRRELPQQFDQRAHQTPELLARLSRRFATFWM